jgi:mono/diheme cytochrome c family protein
MSNRVWCLLFLILLLFVSGSNAQYGTSRVLVPTLGGGYNPNDRNVEIILRELYKVALEQLAELKEMRAQLKATPAETAQPQDIGRLVGESCVVCHNTKDAAKNGGLSLVNEMSEISEQSVEMKRRIRNRIQAGSMPPVKSGIPPLSGQQKTALLNLWPVKEEGK